MYPVLIVLAIAVLLFSAAFGIFALLIVGIRRGDRSHLADDPGNQADAIARRLLVGVRSHSGSEEDK